MRKLESIPTNVITGFLGVGKTTAILNLLSKKPKHERWAVLVNEFGEVGIDGSLMSGQEAEEQGVFIREVPGGCMCCAAGLPMQIALNMLLSRAKPDRLLIEPTGLGHPKEVLEVLSASHYQDVLDLKATITLVDARKIHDKRYTDHLTFNQQLAIADVIVANKSDQYQSTDFPALLDFLDHSIDIDNTSIFQVSQGELQLDWLTGSAGYRDNEHSHEHHGNESDSVSILQTPELPEVGYLSIDNEGEGFYSRGWIFHSDWIFDADKINALLLGVEAERIKGVFLTDNGVVTFNKADNVLSEFSVAAADDSRIECITRDRTVLETLEVALMECVISKG